MEKGAVINYKGEILSMNDLEKEILDNYQIRKTKKQKSRFIEFASNKIGDMGYGCYIEKGSLGARNIVVGDVKSAKVVFTAHYDTCPRLPVPNFITPKRFSIYLLYQLLITLGMFLIAGAVSFLLGFCAGMLSPGEWETFAISYFGSLFILLFLMYMLLFGPANKHTVNDNTSGVICLFEIMKRLPREEREKAAFIFFDLEEVGLVGSSSFAKMHRSEMKDKLLINFDCISDGDNFLFALKKGTVGYKEKIERAYQPTRGEGNAEVLTKGVFYPSDQMVFPLGVGVCALRSTKKGLLYMNRIHTGRDTIYREENITYFADGSTELVRIITDEDNT